jgi:hypothetical protein
MIHSALRIAISAPLLAPPGGYRSAGIHTYIQHSLQHLLEVDPALRLTLFAAHPPEGLPSSIEVQRPRWNTDRPAYRIAWEQLALPVAVRRAVAAVLHATAFVAPRRARRIIAISDCARRDVHRLYGVPLERITVA